jgi:glycerol-3-phosphate dehydrogenase
MMKSDVFDVVVIGGGVLGTAVAARLSSTSARVALLESEADVAEHASKGNAGVAVSYYGAPGLQQTSLINASNPLWEELTARLDVPYRRLGGVMVALSEHDEDHLPSTLEEIHACGVRGEMATTTRVLELEPLISNKVRSGLFMPDEGVIDPIRLTVAYAVLAATNGVQIRLSETVLKIEQSPGRSLVITDKARLETRFVVNAAGVRAAHISQLAGGEAFTSYPRKGQYVVLDRSFGSQLSRIVFSTHTPTTKGSNVVPTTHGSVLLGPTATDLDDADDRATDAETIDWIIDNAKLLVPSTASAPQIKTFAANRPAGDEAHRLRRDEFVPNLVHVTDRSAGVSISPAAAELALSILRDAGLDVLDKPNAITQLPAVPRLRTSVDPMSLPARDPLYGQVICACEHVSAAEINQALSGPVPAISVDGVRKRSGAGYGRCQGSLCMAGVSFLTAMATGKGPAHVKQTARGTVGS